MRNSAEENEPLLGKSSRPSIWQTSQKWRASKCFMTSAVCMAVFADNFLYGMVIPIAPRGLVERAHVSKDHLQQWISIMLATFGVAYVLFCPISVYIANRVRSFRTLMFWSVINLILSIILYCIGRNVWLHLIARGMQGASGAIIGIAGTAALLDRFGPEAGGASVGYIGLSVSSGALIGPIVSGFVYDHAGWYSAFAVAGVLVSIDTVTLALMIEKPRDSIETGNDEAYYPEEPTESVINSTGLGNVDMNRKRKQSTLKWNLTFGACLWAIMLGPLVQTGYESTIPLYVMKIFSWTSTACGLLFLAYLPVSAVSPKLGTIAGRQGARWITLSMNAGMIIVHGLLCLIRHNSIIEKVLLVGLSLPVGACEPVFTTVNISAMARLAARDGKSASRKSILHSCAMANAAIAIGAIVGPIWAGAIKLKFGWIGMNVAFVILQVCSGIGTFLFLDDGNPNDDEEEL